MTELRLSLALIMFALGLLFGGVGECQQLLHPRQDVGAGFMLLALATLYGLSAPPKE